MDMIQYRGAYRFADRDSLDQAIAIALENNNLDWQKRFSRVGSSLRIDLDLPAGSDQRQLAAQVMQTLALSAVEGIVVARHRELAIDVFVCPT
jgi:hypothetical protein